MKSLYGKMDWHQDSQNPVLFEGFSSFEERYDVAYTGLIFNQNRLLEEYREPSFEKILLQMYLRQGVSFPKDLEGEFSIVIFDRLEQTLFAARDRLGLQPLLYAYTPERILIASELKYLLDMGLRRRLDETALYQYLQLNYVPEPFTMFQDAQKLEAGNYLIASKHQIEVKPWYQLPQYEAQKEIPDYPIAQQTLRDLADKAIDRRIEGVSDFGTFLSGGIDSTVVTALTAQKTNRLKTFSIGYQDEPFFDETAFAELVSKRYNTEHHVFKLSNQDLLESLQAVMSQTSEPYADSSGLALNRLCKMTEPYCPVILSGDGCDELFAGYNKHSAELRVRERGFLFRLALLGAPLWSVLPQSRHAFLGNKIRQLNRFAQGGKLTPAERYWRWCSLTGETEAARLLSVNVDKAAYRNAKSEHLRYFTPDGDFNECLYTDLHLVLNGDMIPKVFLNATPYNLSVRAPFLDTEIVEYVMRLPYNYKINGDIRKKILRETFCTEIPEALYNRPKRGFEVPLLKWFRTDLKPLIHELLNEDLIRSQGIFNPQAIAVLKDRIHLPNAGESAAQVFALLMFQNWWKKWLNQ